MKVEVVWCVISGLLLLAPANTAALAREERQLALLSSRGASIAELKIEAAERVEAGARVQITVRARDGGGRAVDGELELEADAGELSAVSRAAKGVYRAELVVPRSISGVRSVFLLARARSGRITSSVTMALAPGPLASLKVDGPESLLGDGSTHAQLTVAMADAFGNPIDGMPRIEAQYGELRALESTGPGFWVFTYEARRVLRDVDERLLVRAGAISTRHVVKLVAPSGALSVSLKGGVALRAGGVGASIGAEGAAWTRLGSQQFGLVFEGSWWKVGGDRPAQGVGQVEWSYLPLTASLAWRLPMSASTMLWLSAGGGAAKVWSSEKVTGQPTVTETGWTTVATAAVAGGLRLWGGYTFVELRASLIGDAHLATLSGSIVPVFLQVGYRFDAW